MEFKKIIDEVISNSQIDDLPSDLMPVTFFPWKPDISSDKDWDDFTGGQLVCHNYWEGDSFKGMIDVSNLQFGNSPTSFWGMLTYNEQMTIYTKEYIDLSGKFLTIGTDTDNFYYAMSFELDNFQLDEKTKTKGFYGKILLVNIQKFLDNQFNDANEAPIINITAGKLNEEIKIPIIKQHRKKEISDPNVKNFEEGKKKIPMAHAVELFFPKPAILIGGGIDFVSNSDRSGLAPANLNRLIKVKEGTTTPSNYPTNPYYCILPTQFNIPSIDNYGFTHPADRSNVIKTLMATQSMGQIAQTGLQLGGGLLGKAASAIGSAVIGQGQKHFGDKGTLANSGAINSSFLSGESDPIKFFIQGDAEGGILDSAGQLNLKELTNQNDYLEVNQANGEFGKYGKPMSPSNNGQFDTKQYYRALGMKTFDLNGDIPDKLPFLNTPFAGKGYNGFRITKQKINALLSKGMPRQQINSGDILKPMLFPETWSVYIRNMFFRPDPYSFFNWTCLMPAEIGVWDVKKDSSISYDTKALSLKETGLSIFGSENTNIGTIPSSYWNKTILVSQITENDLYDPNKTFSSFRFEFDDGALNDLYQVQIMAITSSTIGVKVLDDKGNIIREHKFNSQGINVGTSASWGTVLQL